MPRQNSDSDEEGIVAGLVLDRHGDRSTASSIVSMEIHDRVDALTRANEELIRKKEAEQASQNKLAEHDMELDENRQRLEESRSELNSSNREEKELKAKDVSDFSVSFILIIYIGWLLIILRSSFQSRNIAQIAALDAEMAKVQKQLDAAKATYI
jgi:ABC-type Fe3+-citrate transport system substrate-binding protein